MKAQNNTFSKYSLLTLILPDRKLSYRILFQEASIVSSQEYVRCAVDPFCWLASAKNDHDICGCFHSSSHGTPTFLKKNISFSSFVIPEQRNIEYPLNLICLLWQLLIYNNNLATSCYGYVLCNLYFMILRPGCISERNKTLHYNILILDSYF